MNAILERIAELRTNGAVWPEFVPQTVQTELEIVEPFDHFVSPKIPMNEHILEIVEQVLSHRLPEEKKLAIAYRLMSLYQYDFELDDCSSFIPEGY